MSTTVLDLTTPPDLASAADLAPLPACNHGQELVNGACQCKAANLECPGAQAYCCAAAQACLSPGTDSTQRCSGPSARWDYGMAYDLTRNSVVIFGGEDNGLVPLGDTITFDQYTWDLPTPANPPAARREHILAYDGNTGKVILFGGRLAANMYSAETWSWDGATWTKLTPATSPAARQFASAVWDPDRKRIVLFGGTTADNASQNDTWEWTGTTWQSRTVTNKPTEREGHAMAYDAARHRVVLFGGFIGAAYAPAETWLYDGGTWTNQNIAAASSPSVRSNAAMAYDPVRQRVVLFGGESSAAGNIAGYMPDTWEWDGAAWTKMAPAHSPLPRFEHRMVYDANRKAIVVFGGHLRFPTGAEDSGNDLWAWDGIDWKSLY